MSDSSSSWNTTGGSFTQGRGLVPKWRRRKQALIQAVCFLSIVFVASVLGFLVFALVVRGYHSLDLSFFLNGDSSVPERAGILGALVGSLLVLVVTASAGLVLGISAAIYLGEFAPKNSWLMRLFELGISNLASVPPVLFGVFGLVVFLSLLHVPRSSVLAGGLVLTLVVLPSIIVVSKQALASVPAPIRHGALALGASREQVVFHHVLPVALPRILTGCLITLVRSFGETSPLLMVGMVAFIHDVPRGILDPATTIPVQIYIWANNPHAAFVQKGACAVLVLLFFLVVVNALVFWLRARFERYQ